MKKIFLLLFLIAGSMLIAQTTQTELLNEYLNAYFNGNYKKVYSMQCEELKGVFDEEKIKQSVEQVILAFGNFESIYSTEIIEQHPYTVYIQIIKTEEGYIKSTITFDQDDLIAGFYINAAKDPRTSIAYIDEDKFEEKKINFGIQGWELDGALTMPLTDKAVPLVIIVGGSGPTDMDASVGANTPYKDIAYGLSSNGIAVLRYNKRTAQYGAKISESMKENDTMIDIEYIQDIEEAVKFASKIDGISSIILAGHSLGAAIVPYMAAELNQIDGIMLLAPAIRRMAQVSLDQNIYLKDSYNITDEQLEQVTQFFTMVLNHELPEDFVVQPGLTVSYYYEWDKYRAIEDLENTKLPVLILIGEEDFQATVEGDFTPLKEKFQENERFEFHSFKGLNHLFIKSEEGIIHTTEEYNIPGFVDEDFIKTVVKWVESKF